MGEFLTTPNKKKESNDGENSFVKLLNNIIKNIAKIRCMWHARLA
jgi:hypothetical protein